jgi:predicted NBD/HSP70 family sugar kinase
MLTDATPPPSRLTNRLRVLRVLARHPGSSRADVVQRTGLSRSTVSALLDELEAAGVVAQQLVRDDGRPRGAGRPPVQVSLAPRAAFAVGLDVGHRHIRAALCDLSGEPVAVEHSEAEVDHAPGPSLDLARELVHAVLAQAGVAREQVIGVGMGIAAPVDARRGTAHVEGILPSWGGVQPAAEMEARLGLPVQLENDANVGALGEHRFGAGRGVEHLAYVRLSAGIGAGLVLDGRPYRGGGGIAGELGHLLANPDGAICRCGNRGCLETVASPVAVAALLERSRGMPVGVAELLARVEQGDRGARRAVADAGAAVGRAVAALVNLFNPELVVIGGELAATGEVLLDPLRAAIEREALAPAAAQARVVRGALGGDAEVLGAAALVLERAPQALAQRVAAG